MRKLILGTFLLLTISSFGQKNYTINTAVWTYEIPENYKIRVDNFSASIKVGDSVIKENTITSAQTTDSILLSAGKRDSSDINIILASYQGNSNIEKYTLEGYVIELVGFMKYNFQKSGTDALITTKSIKINNVPFSLIEYRIYHKDINYTYWTGMYIAELSNREFTITVTYDNEKDKHAIEQSILKSTFHIK